MFKKMKSWAARTAIKRHNDGVRIGSKLRSLLPFGAGSTLDAPYAAPFNPNPIKNPLLNPLAAMGKLFGKKKH